MLCLLAIAAMLTGMIMQQTVVQYRTVHNYVKTWQIREQLETDLNFWINGDNLTTSIVTHLTTEFVHEELIDHLCSIGQQISILTLTHQKNWHYVLYVRLQQHWNTCSGAMSRPRVVEWNLSQS